jgi:hypothetical protein
MEITRTVKAPREFIFDKIYQSGLYDIEQQTGKKPKKLDGYELVKNFGKNSRAKMTFKVTEPSLYSFKTENTKNTYDPTWEFHKIDNTTTDVVIREEMVSHGFIQKLNDQLIGFMVTGRKRKQMLAILDSIEKLYQGQK